MVKWRLDWLVAARANNPATLFISLWEWEMKWSLLELIAAAGPLRIENGKLLEWNEESLEWTMKQRKKTAPFNPPSIHSNSTNQFNQIKINFNLLIDVEWIGWLVRLIWRMGGMNKSNHFFQFHQLRCCWWNEEMNCFVNGGGANSKQNQSTHQWN